MKPILIFTLSSLLISFSASADPLVSLECTTNNADLKLTATLDQPTGDLIPDSLRVTVAGVEKAAVAKQYMNYDNDIFIIASLGADTGFDDVGYILDVDHSDDETLNEFDGDIERYSVTSPGTRTVDKSTETDISCVIN